MDGRQFDNVTRALGRGATRREVTKLIAGGALAVLGLGRASSAGATGDRWDERGDVLICHRDRSRDGFKKVALSKNAAKKHLREHDDDFLWDGCCADRDCPEPDNPCARAVCRQGACVEKPGHRGDICGEAADACSPAPVCVRGSTVCPPASSACADDEVCRDGACVSRCVPNCDGRACGDDGCGGSCGSCGSNEVCDNGSCACVPTCEGGSCGDDGCGGECGLCDANEVCQDGSCLCVPECSGVVCGDDGCGGSCGECAGNEVCDFGTCVCVPACDGRSCGDDGCGGSCGMCGSGEECREGSCVCIPACNGSICGDDGCGGSCGTCGPGDRCDDGACVPICVPDCRLKTCGDDGCGGSCGVCSDTDICCDGACVDPNRSDHCGACGNACASTESCVDGACVAWVPGICIEGADADTGAPYTVCRADAASAWVSGTQRGIFHADQICRDLGYSHADAYGGTCRRTCGTCQTEITSCAEPGREEYNGVGHCGVDDKGLKLCYSVHWRCTA